MKLLRIIKLLCICMLILQFFFVSKISYEVSADDLGPEIANVYTNPKYPIHPDTVTIYATVKDPDGVEEVLLYYCDEEVCYKDPIVMTWTGNDDVYSGNLLPEKTWQSGTVVGYNIFANDSLSNENNA